MSKTPSHNSQQLTLRKAKAKELHHAIENDDLSRIEYLASTRSGLTSKQILLAICAFKDNKSQLEEKNALMIAIHLGDLHLCKHLLLEGADLKIGSPLSTSLKLGHYNIAKLLIDSGADVNCLNNGKTPMFYAIKEDSPVFIVKDLLTAGADKNGIVFDDNQDNCFRKPTPLVCAILSKNIPVMKFLLENSVDVNIAPDETSSALFAAVFMDSLEMMKLLIDAGVNTEDGNQGRIFHLAMDRSLDILELLVKKCSDINTMINPQKYKYMKLNSKLGLCHDGNRLHMAIALCHFGVVKILIDNGANVNIEVPQSSVTPLHLISTTGESILSKEEKKNYLKIISLLIVNGAYTSKVGSVPNTFGLNECWLALEHIIRSFGLYINKTTPMFLLLFRTLLQHKKYHLIQLCIDYGASCAEIVEDFYVLPLGLAIEVNNPNMAKIFLKNTPYLPPGGYANTEVFQRVSSTIKVMFKNEINLSKSIVENDAEKAKAYLISGAISSGSIIGSRYPLHQASELGHFEVLNVLLEYGSPVNLIDCNSRLPIHLAASKGYLNICKSLLRHGASYDYPDPNGLSPLQLAQNQALGDSLGVVKLIKRVDKLFRMVRKGNTKVFKKLEKSMESKDVFIFVNCVNKRGCTLMGEALRRGFMDIAEDILFLKFEADKSPE